MVLRLSVEQVCDEVVSQFPYSTGRPVGYKEVVKKVKAGGRTVKS